MKWALLILPVLLASCANVASTRIEYCDGNGGSLIVEMPKEVEATGLLVDIDAKGGRATITAEKWKSKNVETIKAQGERESEVAGKVAEGAIKGAVKGLKSFP